jgi:hypothetical protein
MSYRTSLANMNSYRGTVSSSRSEHNEWLKKELGFARNGKSR